MSSGVTILGRNITMTLGGVTLAGVVEKSLSMTNESVETSDDQSSGWQEFGAEPGKKGLSLSISGIFKNAELFETFFNSASQMASCVITIPDGATTSSTLTFDAFIEGLEAGMPMNEGTTFSCTCKSSGEPTFVAGT